MCISFAGVTDPHCQSLPSQVSREMVRSRQACEQSIPEDLIQTPEILVFDQLIVHEDFQHLLISLSFHPPIRFSVVRWYRIPHGCSIQGPKGAAEISNKQFHMATLVFILLGSPKKHPIVICENSGYKRNIRRLDACDIVCRN